MPNTNYQGHRLIGSGENFERFRPYMGVAVLLVLWPRQFEQIFLHPKKTLYEIWL